MAFYAGVDHTGPMRVRLLTLMAVSAVGLGACPDEDATTPNARDAAVSAPAHVCTVRPVKRAPPPGLVDVQVVGRPGNEWTAPVAADGVTLQVRFLQAPRTKIETAHFEITPKDAPSDRVIRRLPIRDRLGPGATDVAFHWDGLDAAGDPVPAGDYRLSSSLTVNGFVSVTCPDGTAGFEPSGGVEGRGLGLLSVAPPRT